MQRDRNAVAREGGDDRRLVAYAPRSAAGRDIAVGNRCNRKRTPPAGDRAGEPLIELRRRTAQRREQRIPALPERRQMPPPHHQAQIGDAVLHGLEPRIAARKERQLDRRSERGRLIRREPPMQLERDEIVLRARRPLPAAQIMLAGREKDLAGRDGVAVVEIGAPAAIAWRERAHAATAAERRAPPRRRATPRRGGDAKR